MLRVGTGNIELVSCNPFARIQEFDGVFVIFAGIAEYIRNDHRIFDLAKPWQFFFYERPSTNILQSNGIQHSSRRFVQARRRIADLRLFRESLYDKEIGRASCRERVWIAVLAV